jgi:hypothetical protein
MKKFECIQCDYETQVLCNYKRHCNTSRHNKLHNNVFLCNICGKNYNNRTSLWYHHKKCKSQLEILNENTNEKIKKIEETITINTEELTNIKETITTNTEELKDEIHQVKTSVENVKPIHNHFNLNIFLNEQCKNALNWDEFIKHLQITFDVDANITDNVSRMICNGINELGIYKRPIHCTDAKRKKLYIKNDNVWDNDKAQTILPLTGNKLQQQIGIRINEWKTENNLEDGSDVVLNTTNKNYSPINYNKCINQIVKTSVIPKDHSNDLTVES